MAKKIIIALGIVTLVCLAILYLMLQNAVIDKIEVEPNNSFTEAKMIITDGRQIKASIQKPGDEDYYYFDGESGYSYTMTLYWLSGEELDLCGSWYAADYNFLDLINKNGKRNNEKNTIDFTSAQGRCFLKVKDCQSETGKYIITITKRSIHGNAAL